MTESIVNCTICCDQLLEARNKVVCTQCFNFICKTCYNSLNTNSKQCPVCRHSYIYVYSGPENVDGEIQRLRQERLQREQQHKIEAERRKELELSLMTPAPRKIQKSYRRLPTAITIQK